MNASVAKVAVVAAAAVVVVAVVPEGLVEDEAGLAVPVAEVPAVVDLAAVVVLEVVVLAVEGAIVLDHRLHG